MNIKHFNMSWIRYFRIDEIIGLAYVGLGIIAPVLLYIQADPSGMGREQMAGHLVDASITLSLIALWLLLITRYPNRFRILRDFSPFLMVIAIYMRFHDVILLLNPQDFHPILVEMESRIFGGQPTVWLQRFYHPLLTDWFALAYMHYYLVTLLLVVLLYLKGAHAAFRNVMLTMMVTYYLGFLGYLLFPAASPYVVMPSAFEIDIWSNTGYPSDLVQWIVGLSPYRARDAFPSLHNAITLLTLIAAWRTMRPFFWVQLPLALSLVVATVYLRYHFVLDIFAGFMVLATAYYIAPVLETWWRQKQSEWLNQTKAQTLSGV